MAADLADHADRRGLAHQVLERVVDNVARSTAYQRVLATCYRSPIRVGSAASTSTVLEYASRGLRPSDERSVQQLVEGQSELSGARYHDRYRLGNSYFYPDATLIPEMGAAIHSHRRYLAPADWNHRAALLMPFWLEDQVLGQISVDDPRDGASPTPAVLASLEEVASVAGLALWEACDIEELTESHVLFEFLAESGVTGVIIVADGRIRYGNSQAERMLGYDGPTLRNLVPWWSFLHPDDRPFAWSCDQQSESGVHQIRAVRRDGRPVWLSLQASPMRFRGQRASSLQFYDISDRIALEGQLREKALRDPLTGLRNRSFFYDTIHLEVNRCQRYKRSFTLVIADLRDFKAVNDTLGHLEGDRVLVEVATMLQNELRESDWVVRYGGDEFLLVLPETGGDLESLIERLQRGLASWASSNLENVPLGIDFGWATWSPDEPRPIAELLKAADDVLYDRKRSRAATNRQAIEDHPLPETPTRPADG